MWTLLAIKTVELFQTIIKSNVLLTPNLLTLHYRLYIFFLSYGDFDCPSDLFYHFVWHRRPTDRQTDRKKERQAGMQAGRQDWKNERETVRNESNRGWVWCQCASMTSLPCSQWLHRNFPRWMTKSRLPFGIWRASIWHQWQLSFSITSFTSLSLASSIKSASILPTVFSLQQQSVCSSPPCPLFPPHSPDKL